MSGDFAGSTVIVTGADGFIGSHLVERLVGLEATVRALVYYNAWNSIGWLADLDSDVLNKVQVVRGDVRDARFVEDVILGNDYVFHLASLIGIPYSYQAAQSYLETNSYGTLNVLEACKRSTSLRRLIHTSTSEVYGTAQYVPIDEGHALAAQSPYAASKCAADKFAESFFRSFGVPVVTVRPFNTYGPRQTARAVIPTIIGQLLSMEPKLKLGALSPTRDFNYVGDTVAGILALGGCEAAEGEVVNIGTGGEWSIDHTARLLMQICGRKVELEAEGERMRPKNSEVERLVADNTKIRTLTSWAPQVSFEDGLKRTVDWWRSNPEHLSGGEFLK